MSEDISHGMGVRGKNEILQYVITSSSSYYHHIHTNGFTLLANELGMVDKTSVKKGFYLLYFFIK